MIPFCTTTITLLRAPTADDGWPDDEPTYVPIATGVRAVISRQQGDEVGVTGQRSTLTAKLVCDPCELAHTDLVLDESTELSWSVDWVAARMIAPPTVDHIEAGLRRTVAELAAAQATVDN